MTLPETNHVTERRSPVDKSPNSSTEMYSGEKQSLLPPDKSRLCSPSIRRYVPLEIVIFGYFFGVILCLPLSQFYIVSKLTEEYGAANKTTTHSCDPGADNSSNAKLEQKIQTKASEYTTYLIFAMAFPGIIQTFIFGSISDKQGRRVAMFMALTGLLLRELVYMVVFHVNLPLGYMFIGNALDGLTGGFGTMLTALCGAIADITAPGPERAFRITVVQAFQALAAASGQLVAGVWIDAEGFKQPLYFVTSLTGATLLFTLFVLPETRTNINKDPVSFMENLKSVKRSFKLYTQNTPDNRRWKLIVCLFSFIMTFSVVLTLAVVLLLYLLATPFCWSRASITGYNSIRTIVGWFCLLVATRTCGRYLSELTIAVVACTSSFLFLLLVGFAYNTLMLYLAVLLGIFSEGCAPMVRSVMSRLVSSDEQGALFASVSAVEMLASAVLGVAATLTYRATLSFFPGLVFVVLAGFMLINAILLGMLNCTMRRDEVRQTEICIAETSTQKR